MGKAMCKHVSVKKLSVRKRVLLDSSVLKGSVSDFMFYCPFYGSLCDNYRLLKDGSFNTRCRRCRRFDADFLMIFDVFGDDEFVVVPK